MNHVILIGRLTKNPDYREVSNMKGNHHIVNFNLAVDRIFGEGANFIRITAFGKSADFARDYFRCGMRVAVSGEIETGSYIDRDTGKTVYTTEVIARKLEFADGKKAQPDNIPPLPDDSSFMTVPPDFEESVPFC